jgi:chemotaxis protein MotB
MDTYGDMVTLLLTFFVLLFSFSNIDAKKFEQLAQSLSGMTVVAVPALDPDAADEPALQGAGGFVITSSKPDPSATPAPTSEEMVNGMNVTDVQNEFDELYEKLKNHIQENNLGYILNVEHTDQYTVLLRMSDQAFFDPGSAVIGEDARAALDAVCDIFTEFEGVIKVIHIEGHTDNVPIHNANYEDNWELSMDRADNVRKYIIQVTDINPALLVPSYYGEFHPVASNDTPEGRTQNRRVDFVIESILNG